MRAKDRFSKAIQSSLLPGLRELGFKGSVPTLRHFIGKDTVFVINLQATRGAGVFVNLGVHFLNMRLPWTKKPIAKAEWPTISESSCAFRARLWDVVGPGKSFREYHFFPYGRCWIYQK